MAWERLRTIVEGLDVTVIVELCQERHPRFNEAWDGLKWLLARTPDLKEAMIWDGDGNGPYRAYVAAGDALAGTPDIWVVYTFSDTEVVLIGVQAHEAAKEPEL